MAGTGRRPSMSMGEFGGDGAAGSRRRATPPFSRPMSSAGGWIPRAMFARLGDGLLGRGCGPGRRGRRTRVGEVPRRGDSCRLPLGHTKPRRQRPPTAPGYPVVRVRARFHAAHRQREGVRRYTCSACSSAAPPAPTPDRARAGSRTSMRSTLTDTRIAQGATKRKAAARDQDGQAMPRSHWRWSREVGTRWRTRPKEGTVRFR